MISVHAWTSAGMTVLNHLMVVKVKNVDGAIIAALNLPSSNQKRLRKLSRFFAYVRLATMSDTGRKIVSPEIREGNEVRMTQVESEAGSAQASVPFDPLWPKLFSEQSLAKPAGPIMNPIPRRASRPEVWF